MCIREGEVEKDDIEPLSAQPGESIGQDRRMGDLKSVQRPFGQEILRQLGVNGIVFYEKELDHKAALRVQSATDSMLGVKRAVMNRSSRNDRSGVR